MRTPLLLLVPNRVRRGYRGGACIDRLHGRPRGEDTFCPEEWLGSLVPARNPGLPPIPDEGLSRAVTPLGERLLRDVIAEDPAYYLGEYFDPKRGPDLGFLFKILDSAMRLHVQAHPTAAFARERLGSPYGKLECYYILDVREGVDPSIRLGFQRAPSPAAWRDIIERQDIAAMDACFDPVPVRPGEVWLIPGGVPHAIGEGILMLEMMEPSDLVVRCEFEREGVTVPPQGRFMGRDLDFCLQVFDYRSYSAGEAARRFRLTPERLLGTPALTVDRLVGRESTSCFESRLLSLSGAGALPPQRRPQVGVVCRGRVTLSSDGETLTLRPGDSFFARAGAALSFSGASGARVCTMLPGERESEPSPLSQPAPPAIS